LALRQTIKLQVKLQQAQFLARLYAEKLAADTEVSDSEITVYLTEHPEFDIAGQRAKGEKILARVISGEDFAKLANEFTEDPGNKNASTGELNGGRYVNVHKGVMVPQFEKAALALEAGQVSPELVETDYGFHIIKLESKSGDTYDVRHILIATGVGDPSHPEARTVPIREHIKKELEGEKEREIIAGIVAANNISVPKDFVVPPVTIPGEAPKTMPKAKPRSARRRT
jgi:parvulin-like peptidyl-prolyl isomerase